MSFIHKVAIGHDNIVGLVRINPPPRCAGLNYGVWIPTALGDVPNGSLFGKLLWDGEMLPDDMDAVLTQLGFVSTTPVAVTLTLPSGAARTTGYYNCYVSYPKTLNHRLGYLLSPEIDVRVVEQLA